MITAFEYRLPTTGVKILRLPIIQHFITRFEQQPIAPRRRPADLRLELCRVSFGKAESLTAMKMGVFADKFSQIQIVDRTPKEVALGDRRVDQDRVQAVFFGEEVGASSCDFHEAGEEQKPCR